MFPRGPRFPAVKVPDVPGPNTYNPQDPEYDAYKRGAFLEKTNRFPADKPSDVPGPGTYTTDMYKHSTKPVPGPKSSATDRFAALQRKVEELERVHAESKKEHQQEQERLRLALAHAQRAAADDAECADKLKKQADALDARVQDLKKAGAADQAELRDLRTKLRATEHDRAQAIAKQGDAADTRRALQAAEARRKDELRERDRRIAELEKATGAEKKRREAAEARLAEAKSRADGEAQQARGAASGLEAELQESRADARRARDALEDLRACAAGTEDELAARLEEHRVLLARITQEYGRLASVSVASAEHARVKDENTTLHMRVFRLERKLANAEGQVIELANLVRYTKDDNALLSTRLCEADTDAQFYSQALRENAVQEDGHAAALRVLEEDVSALGQALRQADSVKEQTLCADARLWSDFYRLRCEALVFNSSGLLKGLDDAQVQAQQSSAQVSEAQAKYADLLATLEAFRTEHASTQAQLTDTTVALETCKATEETLRKQLDGLRAQSQADIARVEHMLQKEKETTQRLAETVHMCRAAEETLQAEVDELTSELALAERFQNAYNNLAEEIDAVIARNALAEEEALHLRKFNAEIIGHNNPAQRIMYVDRIRSELHETKQKLLKLTRERDTAVADGDDLRYELQLYKSVAIPPELKPRTTVTRVGRVPLVTQNMAASNGGAAKSVRHAKSTSIKEDEPEKLDALPEHYFGAEMTIDEIM